MKKILFYILVAVTSYFAGVLAYLGYLSLVYHQGIGSESSKFIVWTLPPYLFVILPFYTLMFRWSKAALWLRLILLIGLSVVAAASVPFLMGFGIWRLQDLFSPELGLFMILFASSSLVFTVGSFIASKKRGHKLFMLASLIIIYFAVSTLVSEAEKSRPVIHQIPHSFHGTVTIHYGEPHYPPIPRIKGYEVIRIPENGIYYTSSPRPSRGIRHTIVDERGQSIHNINSLDEISKYGDSPTAMISEYEVP
ncbi:DUF6843 domain-containing protein [Paenibacillus sp. PL91]|uniref:DUF6843 domain-containing protein n=1 Tax=Paenibacillus sp. PL91 TaxID=2729538 RepID=UPI00145EBFCA|nr:hypothetical protein [Paenibacillus sp. PL91]MBC9202898.1 hypothetical protein [Paenibacillus sp. PL91]